MSSKEELIPKNIKLELIAFDKALKILHYPPVEHFTNISTSVFYKARKRLVFEELLVYYLKLFYNKHKIKKLKTKSVCINLNLINQFIFNLPFSLTSEQKKIAEEIYLDLKKKKPMLRLIQGDVGSGKTVIAALAALFLISDNKQVAFMTPTKILAEQHFKNFKNWFSPMGIVVTLLISNNKNKEYELKKKIF